MIESIQHRVSDYLNYDVIFSLSQSCMGFKFHLKNCKSYRGLIKPLYLIKNLHMHASTTPLIVIS